MDVYEKTPVKRRKTKSRSILNLLSYSSDIDETERRKTEWFNDLRNVSVYRKSILREPPPFLQDDSTIDQHKTQWWQDLPHEFQNVSVPRETRSTSLSNVHTSRGRTRSEMRSISDIDLKQLTKSIEEGRQKKLFPVGKPKKIYSDFGLQDISDVSVSRPSASGSKACLSDILIYSEDGSIDPDSSLPKSKIFKKKPAIKEKRKYSIALRSEDGTMDANTRSEKTQEKIAMSTKESTLFSEQVINNPEDELAGKKLFSSNVGRKRFYSDAFSESSKKSSITIKEDKEDELQKSDKYKSFSSVDLTEANGSMNRKSKLKIFRKNKPKNTKLSISGTEQKVPDVSDRSICKSFSESFISAFQENLPLTSTRLNISNSSPKKSYDMKKRMSVDYCRRSTIVNEYDNSSDTTSNPQTEFTDTKEKQMSFVPEKQLINDEHQKNVKNHLECSKSENARTEINKKHSDLDDVADENTVAQGNISAKGKKSQEVKKRKTSYLSDSEIAQRIQDLSSDSSSKRYYLRPSRNMSYTPNKNQHVHELNMSEQPNETSTKTFKSTRKSVSAVQEMKSKSLNQSSITDHKKKDDSIVSQQKHIKTESSLNKTTKKYNLRIAKSSSESSLKTLKRFHPSTDILSSSSSSTLNISTTKKSRNQNDLTESPNKFIMEEDSVIKKVVLDNDHGMKSDRTFKSKTEEYNIRITQTLQENNMDRKEDDPCEKDSEIITNVALLRSKNNDVRVQISDPLIPNTFVTRDNSIKDTTSRDDPNSLEKLPQNKDSEIVEKVVIKDASIKTSRSNSEPNIEINLQDSENYRLSTLLLKEGGKIEKEIKEVGILIKSPLTNCITNIENKDHEIDPKVSSLTNLSNSAGEKPEIVIVNDDGILIKSFHSDDTQNIENKGLKIIGNKLTSLMNLSSNSAGKKTEIVIKDNMSIKPSHSGYSTNIEMKNGDSEVLSLNSNEKRSEINVNTGAILNLEPCATPSLNDSAQDITESVVKSYEIDKDKALFQPVMADDNKTHVKNVSLKETREPVEQNKMMTTNTQDLSESERLMDLEDLSVDGTLNSISSTALDYEDPAEVNSNIKSKNTENLKENLKINETSTISTLTQDISKNYENKSINNKLRINEVISDSSTADDSSKNVNIDSVLNSFSIVTSDVKELMDMNDKLYRNYNLTLNNEGLTVERDDPSSSLSKSTTVSVDVNQHLINTDSKTESVGSSIFTKSTVPVKLNKNPKAINMSSINEDETQTSVSISVASNVVRPVSNIIVKESTIDRESNVIQWLNSVKVFKDVATSPIFDHISNNVPVNSDDEISGLYFNPNKLLANREYDGQMSDVVEVLSLNSNDVEQNIEERISSTVSSRKESSHDDENSREKNTEKSTLSSNSNKQKLEDPSSRNDHPSQNDQSLRNDHPSQDDHPLQNDQASKNDQSLQNGQSERVSSNLDLRNKSSSLELISDDDPDSVKDKQDTDITIIARKKLPFILANKQAFPSEQSLRHIPAEKMLSDEPKPSTSKRDMKISDYFKPIGKRLYNVLPDEKFKSDRKAQNLKKIIGRATYRPPKRFKRQRWMTEGLSKHLQKALLPKYGSENIAKSETLIKLLNDCVQVVCKSNKYEEDHINHLKRELAILNIVKTNYDFYEFVGTFLPINFRSRVVPCSKAFINDSSTSDINVPYDHSKLFKNIL